MPRGEMDSGTEFALQALQAQISNYTTAVREQMQDFTTQLREHSKEQRKWQDGVDDKLAQAVAYGPRIDKLETKVCAFDTMYHQSKGAIWATRAIWVVLGIVVSVLLWVYTNIVVPVTSVSKQQGTTSQVAAPPSSPGADL